MSSFPSPGKKFPFGGERNRAARVPGPCRDAEPATVLEHSRKEINVTTGRHPGKRLVAAIALGLLPWSVSACEGLAAPGQDRESRDAALPDLVGKGLQTAQDEAQAAGFTNLTSHDALGRGRDQLIDRNWQVCRQEPAAGTVLSDTKIDFATVKLDEECPEDGESKQPAKVDTKMVDFTGKSLKAARASLPSNASIDTNDVSGEDRAILVESNWQVCGQEPPAGEKYEGQPVRLSAVKFGESCP